MRRQRHEEVAGRLGGLGDDELWALVGEVATAGVGGLSGTVEVGGVPVFVKQVPLTEVELRHPHSTANLFGLPMRYQYGIGSAGFGAWRELATHLMTTAWVLGGKHDGFPLLHHWRVLDRAPGAMDPAVAELCLSLWHEEPAVRARLAAIDAAPAVVLLFLEHVPYTMDAWLGEHDAYEWAALRLREGVRFLESNGLVHFDAHFRNLLTDGERVYFADFGLALHQDFEMRADEYAFFERHRGYDRAYTSTHLTQWLITQLLEIPWSDFAGALADRDLPLPPAARRVVGRNRRVAALMGEFWRGLERSRRDPRYPAELLALAGITPDLGGAVRAVVRDSGGSEILAATDDPAGLAATLDSTGPLDFVCMCHGDYRIEFYDARGERVAAGAYHHPDAVHWDLADDQAALRDGTAFPRWLAAHRG